MPQSLSHAKTSLMLAPPFTEETAKEKGRLGGIQSGISKRAKKQALIAACSPDKAQERIRLQIDKVLKWMENCNSQERYSELAQMLDRLWNKAFPTQGAVKSRSRADRQQPAQPLETPQEPPA